MDGVIDEKLKKVNQEIKELFVHKDCATHEDILARHKELCALETRPSFTDYAFCRHCRMLDRRAYTKKIFKDEEYNTLKEFGYFCVLKNQPTEQNKTCSQFMLKEKKESDDNGYKPE